MRGNGIDDPAKAVLAVLEALVEPLESSRGVVEDSAQMSKLIFAFNGDLVEEVSAGQSSGTLDQLFEWARDAARNCQSKGSGNQKRENDRGGHDDEDPALHFADIGR